LCSGTDHPGSFCAGWFADPQEVETLFHQVIASGRKAEDVLPSFFYWNRKHILPADTALTLYRQRLQSVSMRNWFLVWMLLGMFFLAGCGKDAGETPSPQYQKLTLQDLKSPDTQTNQSQIFFDIVTFELRTDKVRDIAPVLSRFNCAGLRFYSKELFEKNGLSVYLGHEDDGAELASQFRLLQARRIVRTNLITMDKADELFSTTVLSAQRHIFSTLYGDRKIGRTFGPGKIGWVITPSLIVRRDAVNVKVVPAFVPADGANIRLAIGKNELGQKPFEQGQFELTMQEGDFLILAPGRVPIETTLDNMLFGPEDGKMRMYVILFNRVK
jgi:hypothetical protein